MSASELPGWVSPASSAAGARNSAIAVSEGCAWAPTANGDKDKVFSKTYETASTQPVDRTGLIKELNAALGVFLSLFLIAH